VSLDKVGTQNIAVSVTDEAGNSNESIIAVEIVDLTDDGGNDGGSEIITETTTTSSKHLDSDSSSIWRRSQPYRCSQFGGEPTDGLGSGP